MSTNIISLTCPSCGGKLEISPNLNQFACGHCGNEHIVQREGGTVSLAPVLESLKSIDGGTNRTASELAMARLSSEINHLEALLDEITIEYHVVKDEGSKRTASFLIIAGILICLLEFIIKTGGFLVFIGVVLGLTGLKGIETGNKEKDAQQNRENEIRQLIHTISEKKSEHEYHRRMVMVWSTPGLL